MDPKCYTGLKPYVFISYSHRDESLVYPILNTLEKYEIPFWYDKGILTGKSFHEQIAKRIQNCQCFVVFFSNNFSSSEYMNKECLYSIQHEKDIVPVYLDEIKLPMEIDFHYNPIQGIKRNTEEDFVKKLVQVLNSKELYPNAYVEMAKFIPFYNKEGEFAGLTTRRFIHEMPLYHKTSIILVVKNRNGKSELLLQYKLKKSRIGRGLIGSFGGHSIYGESFKETALRELTEELGLMDGLISEEDLHLIDKEGSFINPKPKQEKFYNYESSSVYVYFLPNEYKVKAQENYGDESLEVRTFTQSLEDLQKEYKNEPSKYADDLSRILSKNSSIMKIKKSITEFNASKRA